MNASFNNIRGIASPNRQKKHRRNAIALTGPAPANPESDEIHLLRSINDDAMNYDFSTLQLSAEFAVRRRLRRRRSTGTAHTATTRSVTSIESTTGTQQPQNAPRSPRRTNRGTRNNNQSDSAVAYTAEDATDTSNHTGQDDVHSEIGLDEYLQLSMAFTASLIDQVSDDESVYLADENVTVHTTTTTSRSTNTVRDGARQRQRRRPRPGRRGSMASGSTSANSSSTNGERRAPKKKSPRLPSNTNRRGRPNKPGNLSDLAEQARASIECPICLYHYDEKADRVPCTLRCGHSMCLAHAKQLKNCPICRASFNGRFLKKSVVLCEAANAINSMVSTILE